MKFGNKFLLLGVLYVIVSLVLLLVLAYRWIPPGYAVVGHDSGLPLDAKTFLETRLYAWDDRIGFGLDNSVNFGSLTIHFFDWLSSFVMGVPYAGGFFSVFFWLGLMFLSSLFFAYQLKHILGKAFVFILPPLLTFNFYIFQSMFMLERGKFGVYSATLITLGVLFRMQNKKMGVLSAAIISALAMSIFNGGGLLGITLYGGVILILGLFFIYFISVRSKVKTSERFTQIFLFFAITAIFFLVFNAYSLLPFFKQFFADKPEVLFSASVVKGNQEWLDYVSRSASYLNLFREFGVPDWYGGWGALDKANPSHPYSAFYLNSNILVSASFLLPILSFLSLVLAKGRRQRKVLALFGMISLVGIFLAAGSHGPLGFVYQFLMEKVPGFVLFRSAFYKFGIFYLLGILGMFAFTAGFLLEKLSSFAGRFSSIVLITGILAFIGLWFAYHWVLLDPTKVFAWKPDQSTKVQIPHHVYDFAQWAKENDIGEKRVLLLPPVNKDWETDAYTWGYWSLSPVFYALGSTSVLSNWHGHTTDERIFIDRLYESLKKGNEEEFLSLSQRLNISYLLLRSDVLTDSSWSSAENPESYKRIVESLESIKSVKSFGEWEIYGVEKSNTGVYATAEINFAPDKYVSLANEFFLEGHTVGATTLKAYNEFASLPAKRMEVYDCLSCPLEKKANLQSFPEVHILPNSVLYFLKERQEKRLLEQKKDARGKMADYLGLVLRRSAEERSMADLGVDEKYLINNASIVSSYLDKVYSELSVSQEGGRDFELANHVLEYLYQAEHVFSELSKRNDIKLSNKLTDEMLGVLWETDRIKDYFAPLLKNLEQWSSRKVYKVTLAESGEYDIFFPLDNLPRDLADDPILPKAVEFKKGGQVKTLEVASTKHGWLTSHIAEEKGSGELILQFPDLPNLLTIKNSGLEKFSFGKAACYEGSIANFDKKRAYEVRVWRTDRLRPTRIIFRDKSFQYSEKHGFLQGEDSFEVPATAEGTYARYVFFPSVSAGVISLYVCSDSAELPVLDKIEVREFFSPPVIGVAGEYKETFAPVINYVRKDPTEYQVEVASSSDPYILVLNGKYNPSWKLSIQKENGEFSQVKEHFMVDGYANGWLVSQPVKKMKIEYEPQNVFNKVSIFSAVSSLVAVLWLVWPLVRKRRKNGN